MHRFFFISGLIVTSWLITGYTHAATNADSLKALLSDEQVKPQFDLRIETGSYYQADSPSVSIRYFSEALEIARHLKIDTLEARAYTSLGVANLKADDYREAKYNFDQALDIYKKSGLDADAAFVIYNLGLVSYYTGDYDEAIKNYQNALRVFIKNKNRKYEANTYQNIGIVHHDLENNEEALEYYKKALEINEELDSKSNIAGLTQNIGLLYIKSEDFEPAVKYIQKSLDIYRNLKDNEGIGISLSNMGIVYQKQKKYRLALMNYKKSLDVFTKIDYPYGKIYALHNVGTSYSDLKNYDNALNYYNKSLILAKSKGHIQGEIINYEAMSELYTNMGDYKKALDYYMLFDELQDSVNSVETRNRITEMEALYELEKVNNELVRKNVELDQQKRAKKVFFTGSVFLLFLLVFLVISYVQKNQAKKELNANKLNLERLVLQRTRELNIEINERKIAEESDKLKSAFLANMSHELRTPMNAIIAFTNFIKDKSITETKRDEYISYITTAGESLLHLIDDIIDLAKIESKELKINNSICNVTQLLTELYHVFSELKKKKGKEELELLLNPGCLKHNVIIKTDPYRLKQILSNLLENALKYTDQGLVEFGFGQNESYLEFFVKDTGPGIPREKYEFIFERFSQIDQSIEKQFGGTGLGLAITKNLVNLLGGKIWLKSKVGFGSTFYFTIPYKEITIEPYMVIEQARKLPSFYDYEWLGKTILVAEDEDLNYKVLESALSRTNAKVLRALNGIEAVEHIKDNHIDLILMDIQMPMMDGYKATREIKRINHSIPIIAQTSFAMEGEKEKCLMAGCDDYLAKPLNLNELFGKISRYIN